MRVVDLTGHAATFDAGTLILEENREYRVHLSDLVGEASCRLGLVALPRSVDGAAFVLRLGHAVGQMELVRDAPPKKKKQNVILKKGESDISRLI